MEFTGRVARVHQDNREDRTAKGGPRVRYAGRELLGYTRGDPQMVRDTILNGLAP